MNGKMPRTHWRVAYSLTALLYLSAYAHAARAEETAKDEPPIPPPAADDKPVQQVVTTENKSAVPDNIPAVIETVTAKQIEESVNAMTSAEALKYLPSIEVRERYIGDRNGIVATRTTGTVSSAESMVYADGLLLSNNLGNSYSYPPRWGLVSLQEIQQIDVMYGPFSALYAGNSMGGVITMTTRMPDHPEAHLDLKGFAEDFKLYGTKEINPGYDGSASFGNKIGDFAFWVDADHLESHGHPMSFATVSTGSTSNGATASTGACGAGCTNISNLSGYRVDHDQYGNPRYIFGAYSIDHTIQDQGKIKMTWDITPEIKATYILGLWGDDSLSTVQSYATNTTTGLGFYNGSVGIAGKAYTVSGVDPSNIVELHMMNAASLKSDTKGMFDWEIGVSRYDYVQEQTRTAANYGTNNTGTLQNQDGTGWQTGDLRGIYRAQDPLGFKHEVTAGYHIDSYRLNQYTYNTNVWATGSIASLNSISVGNTQTQAIYLQDAYKFLNDFTLTLGGREEFWNATGGYNYTSGKTAATYAGRHEADFSPKAAISYDVTADWMERFSFGKAYRYPTVNELFQSVSSGNALITNDPDLKPEEILSYDLTSEYTFRNNTTRLSLFQEDRHNALFSQTDTTTSPNVTQYENVDKVRFRGVEMADAAHNIGFDGFDLNGSVTYTRGITMEDVQNSAADGKQWPRVPLWRARLVGVYHQSEELTYSLGVRYAGKNYSTLINNDTNGDVYGGISTYLVTDARVTYKLGNGLTAAVGVDNMTGDNYFVSPHPYPHVTAFSELKFDY